MRHRMEIIAGGDSITIPYSLFSIPSNRMSFNYK